MADINPEAEVQESHSEQMNKREFRSGFVRRQHWHNEMMLLITFVLLIGFTVVSLIVKDRTFSDNENRTLAQRPQLTKEGVQDGSYFTDLSSYLADQIFGRDTWLELQYIGTVLTGQKESGGVYLGKNGYLLQKPTEPNEEALAKTTSAIQQFTRTHSQITSHMLLVPGAEAVMPDMLPSNAPVRDQLADIRAVYSSLSDIMDTLDVSTVLEAHQEEGLYYKTDHHWTSKGAFYAFSAINYDLGITDPAPNYDVYSVSNSFQGTLASQSGKHNVSDSIEIYSPKSMNLDYYVYYPDSQERKASIYESEMLKEKDQYTVFFGGNHALVEIHTTAANKKNLLLFKDSYANCFVQFLYPYYERIIMIDPRYYYDDVNTVLSQNAITDVLYLYSFNTFAEDTSLADVLDAAAEAE